MMSSKAFESLVYPIPGRIVFEIDNIENLKGIRYSDRTKIGKSDWFLDVRTECSDKTAHQNCLSVYLICGSEIEEGKRIEVHHKWCLINQTKPGKDKTGESESVYTRKSPSWGFADFVEWSELISGGYVKDNKILIECSLSINSENGIKRGIIDFSKERPNEEDKKVMLNKKKTSKVEQMSEDVEVSKISARYHFIEGPRMFGLRIKLVIKKSPDSWLQTYLFVESENGSEWWMCDVSITFRIVNYIDDDRSICITTDYSFSEKNGMAGANTIEWDELVDPSKGFIKDGDLKLQVFYQLRSLYGFDEITNKLVDRPLKKMTDTVLVVGGKRLNVPKKVLAEKSLHFRELFSSNPGKSEFELKNVKLEDFIRFLELVHNFDTNICENNATEVLETIIKFKAPECFEMCDKILRAQELEDTMKVLEWVDKYPLPGLRRKFLLKLKDDTLLQSITHSNRYKSLSSDMKVAILEWKVIPEENRMEEVERDDYEFRTVFEEKSGLTDVEIEVDGYSFYANKQILANASNYFMKKFYGPHSESSSRTSEFDVSPLQFEKLLTHIYHPTRPVTYSNVDSLLQLAHQFSVPRLMDKCEEYLVLKDSFELIDKLEYAGKYELPYLLESCLKWANDTEKIREVKSHHKFRRLEWRVVSELTKREAK